MNSHKAENERAFVNHCQKLQGSRDTRFMPGFVLPSVSTCKHIALRRRSEKLSDHDLYGGNSSENNMIVRMKT